jgi:hypothetical protein
MEHFVKLDCLPHGFVFPPSLTDRVRYDSDNQRLIFRGFMSKGEFDRLYLLSDDWGYRRALEELFRNSTDDSRPTSHSVIGRLKAIFSHRSPV